MGVHSDSVASKDKLLSAYNDNYRDVEDAQTTSSTSSPTNAGRRGSSRISSRRHCNIQHVLLTFLAVTACITAFVLTGFCYRQLAEVTSIKSEIKATQSYLEDILAKIHVAKADIVQTKSLIDNSGLENRVSVLEIRLGVIDALLDGTINDDEDWDDEWMDESSGDFAIDDEEADESDANSINDDDAFAANDESAEDGLVLESAGTEYARDLEDYFSKEDIPKRTKRRASDNPALSDKLNEDSEDKKAADNRRQGKRTDKKTRRGRGDGKKGNGKGCKTRPGKKECPPKSDKSRKANLKSAHFEATSKDFGVNNGYSDTAMTDATTLKIWEEAEWMKSVKDKKKVARLIENTAAQVTETGIYLVYAQALVGGNAADKSLTVVHRTGELLKEASRTLCQNGVHPDNFTSDSIQLQTCFVQRLMHLEKGDQILLKSTPNMVQVTSTATYFGLVKISNA